MLTRLCILARGYSSLGDCFSLVGGWTSVITVNSGGIFRGRPFVKRVH